MLQGAVYALTSTCHQSMSNWVNQRTTCGYYRPLQNRLHVEEGVRLIIPKRGILLIPSSRPKSVEAISQSEEKRPIFWHVRKIKY
jgi:hypothetical protein